MLNPQGNSPIANVPVQVWYGSARNSALGSGGVEQCVLRGDVSPFSISDIPKPAKGIYRDDGGVEGTGERVGSAKGFS